MPFMAVSIKPQVHVRAAYEIPLVLLSQHGKCLCILYESVACRSGILEALGMVDSII